MSNRKLFPCDEGDHPLKYETEAWTGGVMSIHEKHLDEIEFLLAQSMNGVHLLFDNMEIAKILHKPTEDKELFSFANMERIQDLFTRLIEQNSVPEKLDFIHGLPPEDFELLLRTYFHILDNTLLANTALKH
jgi:hypothetical protein